MASSQLKPELKRCLSLQASFFNEGEEWVFLLLCAQSTKLLAAVPGSLMGLWPLITHFSGLLWAESGDHQWSACKSFIVNWSKQPPFSIAWAVQNVHIFTCFMLFEMCLHFWLTIFYRADLQNTLKHFIKTDKVHPKYNWVCPSNILKLLHCCICPGQANMGRDSNANRFKITLSAKGMLQEIPNWILLGCHICCKTHFSSP